MFIMIHLAEVIVNKCILALQNPFQYSVGLWSFLSFNCYKLLKIKTYLPPHTEIQFFCISITCKLTLA